MLLGVWGWNIPHGWLPSTLVSSSTSPVCVVELVVPSSSLLFVGFRRSSFVFVALRSLLRPSFARALPA